MPGQATQSATPSSIAGMPMELELPAPPDALTLDVMNLYLRLLPPAFWDELRRKKQPKSKNRIYTAGVVIWLMITQRF